MDLELRWLAFVGAGRRRLGRRQLLRDNLLAYGLGGLVVPFVGIKAIDLVITTIGLA